MWANTYIVNQISDLRKGIADGLTAIALVDDPEPFKYTTVYTLGVLLPPYESLSAKIDGEDQIFEQIYFEYLDQQMSVTSQLLAALHMGKPLMFFVDEESSLQLGYASAFVKYFGIRFGIGIADGIGMGFNINPGVDTNPNYEAFRLEQVYLNCENVLPFEEFCLEYPNGMYPSDIVSQKMLMKMGYQLPPTSEETRTLCANIINSVKNQLLQMQQMNPNQQQQKPAQVIAFKVNKS